MKLWRRKSKRPTCESCGSVAVVVSREEHESTGLPYLCSGCLYEPEVRSPEDGPSEEELEELARRAREIRGM